MKGSSPLLARLTHLSPQYIEQLSAQEMKKLLSELHRQAKQQTSQSCHCGHKYKHKIIEKVLPKNKLKELIRNNLKSMMRKNNKERSGQSSEDINGQSRAQVGGKSNFKQPSSSLSLKSPQKFQTFIRTALQKTSPEELACSICLEVLVSPALTHCGHVFCLQCLDQTNLLNTVCPICREQIKGTEPIVCSLLDKLIQTKMELFSSPEDLEGYQDRRRKFQTWKAGRILDYDRVVEGQLLDVRDTQSIWCQGRVTGVFRSQNEKDDNRVVSIMVHYNRWHKIYNEIIEVPSHRLAPLSCYSGRIQIPRYNLAEESDNVRGSVITGPPRIAMHSPFEFIQILDSESESRVFPPSQLEDEEENEHQFLSNLDPSNSHFEGEQDQEEEEEEREQEEEGGPLGFFNLGRIVDRFRSSFLSGNQQGPRGFRPLFTEEEVEQRQLMPQYLPFLSDQNISQIEGNNSQPEMIEQ